MISITVHQTNQSPDKEPGSADKTQSKRATMSNTIKTKAGDQLEVQYFKRYIKTSAPIPMPRRHIKASECTPSTSTSGSSASSLESDADQMQTIVIEPISRGKLSTAEPELVDKENFGKVANRKLHSRSISLVINPEFSPELGDSSTLRRRRSLPRRTRLRLTKDYRLNEESLRAMRDEISDMEAGKTREEVEFVCTLDDEETEDDVFTSQPTEASQTGEFASSPEILEQFRQAGAILRQISEEFGRSRRRTI